MLNAQTHFSHAGAGATAGATAKMLSTCQCQLLTQFSQQSQLNTTRYKSNLVHELFLC